MTTIREGILSRLDQAIARGKKRERDRLDAIRAEPHGRSVRRRRDGEIIVKPHPGPKPIGGTTRQLYGPRKTRPHDLAPIDAELTKLRDEGVLAFTSGVWWYRERPKGKKK